jgi:hypothetical protein
LVWKRTLGSDADECECEVWRTYAPQKGKAEESRPSGYGVRGITCARRRKSERTGEAEKKQKERNQPFD